MRKSLIALLLCASAFAQTAVMGSFTVATLPSASSVNTNAIAYVTDAANTNTCTSGSGTFTVPCKSNGSAWSPVEPSVNSSGNGAFFSYGMTNVMASVAAATFIASNNQMRVVQFTLTQPWTIGHASINVSTNVAASVFSAGIYSADGTTKLVDTTTFDTSALGIKTKSFTGVLLPRGVYLFAYCANDSTVQLTSVNPWSATATNLINAVATRMGTAANSCTAGALPSSTGAITPAAPISSAVPLVTWEF